MPDFAGTQTTVGDPYVAFAGDQVGAPETWVQGQGLNPLVDAPVGYFVFGVVNTKNCTPVKGSNTEIAGIVMRDQANVFPVSAINAGFSNVAPANYTCSVSNSGSFFSKIVLSLNVGNVINVGDAVWVRNTDGAPVVGVTNESGYTQSRFVVRFTTVTNGSVILPTNVVAISSSYTFLGN